MESTLSSKTDPPSKTTKTKVKKLPKLTQLETKLQPSMLLLSLVWLCVLIFEMVNGTTFLLSRFGTLLWILFVLYFLLRLWTATNKYSLLKKNWLFILAILFTVLRFFPTLQPTLLIRSLNITLGMQVIWIFVSADQVIRFVRRALGHRGVGYVLALTGMVLFAGGAAILHFESESGDVARIQTYGNAVWWTAMQMTNIGSNYTLRSEGGKLFGLMVSIYSAGMFGYLTALFAAQIIDHDIKTPKVDTTYQKQLQDIQSGIQELHSLVKKMEAALKEP